MKFRNGLTIIELMVVVAIIGFLAAIAIPNFQASQIRAKEGLVRSYMSALAQGMEDFAERNNGSYPSVITSQCLDGNFTIKQLMGGAWPKCNPFTKDTANHVRIYSDTTGHVSPIFLACGEVRIYTWAVGGFVRGYIVAGYGRKDYELMPPIRSK